jgi:hypothetical protein
VYLSKTSVLDNSASTVIYKWEAGPTPIAGSYYRTQTAHLPVSESGDYFLIFQTDAGNWLGESNFSNNTVAAPVHFNISMPDLAPLLFLAPSNVVWAPNPAITLVWGVTNQGTGDILQTANYRSDRVYLSSNAVPDINAASIVATQVESDPVPAGGLYWRTNLVRLPVTQDGTYYLFFQANDYPYGQFPESDFSNNLAVARITVHISAPDLLPFGFEAPRTISSAYPIATLRWGVTNQGIGPADGRFFHWTDGLSLITTNSAGGSPRLLGSWVWSQTNLVLPGETFWTTNTVRLPIVESVNYSLNLTVDRYDDLHESNKTNNSATILLSADVVPPDIRPLFLAIPPTVVASAYADLTVAWAVTNQGGSPTQVGSSYYYWYAQVYFSTNDFLDDSALAVTTWSANGNIEPGDSYCRTNKLRLSTPSSGDYYLILRVNAYNALHQLVSSTNVAVAPITLSVLPVADLAPAVFAVPTILTSAPNPIVTFVWGVTNQGLGPAQSDWPWSDALYLSSVPVQDGSETPVARFEGTNSLAAEGIYWRTNMAKVPVTASGCYYLILKTDDYNAIPNRTTLIIWPSPRSSLRSCLPTWRRLLFKLRGLSAAPPISA